MEISGLPRGFSTCCLRFTSGVATAHARLASGWLAGLYREGVEPSGSLRKVSELLHLILPSVIYSGRSPLRRFAPRPPPAWRTGRPSHFVPVRDLVRAIDRCPRQSL